MVIGSRALADPEEQGYNNEETEDIPLDIRLVYTQLIHARTQALCLYQFLVRSQKRMLLKPKP